MLSFWPHSRSKVYFEPVGTFDSPPQIVIAFLAERVFELKMVVGYGPARKARTLRSDACGTDDSLRDVYVRVAAVFWAAKRIA